MCNVTMVDFILSHIDAILDEWQRYVQTLPPAHGMDAADFRTDARAILEAIASDMGVVQSELEQEDKSKGLDLHRFRTQTSAAESHGAIRYSQGFAAAQLIGEYRALRASVIRLWMAQLDSADLSSLNSLVRFNEALDQAMSESVARFSLGAPARHRVRRWR